MNPLLASISRSDRTDGSITLCCFSPPVILLTFVIEAVLAAYVWFRYRSTRHGRLSAVFLILLATFQISEWFICQGGSDLVWSRVGFTATAFLPILGLDFIALLRKKKWPMRIGYLSAAVFSGLFLLLPQAFTAAACTGRFVAFVGGSVLLDVLYAAYYIITLALALSLILKALLGKTPNRRALTWLLVGYLTFILPTVTLYVLVLASQRGVGSILCGFAVLLALIYVGKVLPAVEKR